MTSSPLFIIVAESNVIFGPIFHFGCRRPSSKVIAGAAPRPPAFSPIRPSGGARRSRAGASRGSTRPTSRRSRSARGNGRRRTGTSPRWSRWRRGGRCAFSSGQGARHKREGEEEDGRGIEEGVEPVEEAAMAGQETAGILHRAAPLEGGFEEIPDDRHDGDDEAERRAEKKGARRAGRAGRTGRRAEEEESRGRPEGEAGPELAPEAFPRLLRAHDRSELPLSPPAPDVVGGGVAGPHDREQEHDGLPADRAEADH